ncbi:Recombinase [Actinokineospora alba]|uniref:Recombinase n=1 Tax=Actinokineospora alba TaxID=504798 RepID=A0A1H0LG56_9PSEU|nr:recombinase family protein [Actinokineospora alba]TDP67317.1 recombinase [Actinokineospora alba]SDJ00604.1 Recombinase [Actinokineospora alba]SDO67208.1 Recombinase [Actinokineospora alba]
MTTNTSGHEPDGEIPRWAATAGQGFRAPRWAARLLCSTRRLPTPDPNGLHTASDVPNQVRQQVLREYHAVNLDHARRASEEMVRAGFNTGLIPYGYRAQRVRVTPEGKRPRWRTRLVVEPVEASTVCMIFLWRGHERLHLSEIVRRLSAARYPAPVDPETGQPGVWTRAVVRSILRNPKYTGRQVWGRRHHSRRAPRERWVWSPVWAHPPLITVEEFATANRRAWRVATPPDTPGAVEAQWSEPGRAA